VLHSGDELFHQTQVEGRPRSRKLSRSGAAILRRAPLKIERRTGALTVDRSRDR
jgi:hypothetical protein